MSKIGAQGKTSLRLVVFTLVLIGVDAIRWNVVIGGQLMSKSLRGFTSYSPPLFGIDGVIVAVVLMIRPFIILAIVSYLIPPWQEELDRETERRRPLQQTRPRE